LPVPGGRQLRDQSIEDIDTEVFADSQSRFKDDASDVIISDFAVEVCFGGCLGQDKIGSDVGCS
jgi:hypothetical protein